MRLDLRPVVHFADQMLKGIEEKSYHWACFYGWECMAEMPSPVWAEAEPGIAQYGPGEYEANQRINVLRAAVMVWMMGFINPSRSWEASDEWPSPTNLAKAVKDLREMCPE